VSDVAPTLYGHEQLIPELRIDTPGSGPRRLSRGAATRLSAVAGFRAVEVFLVLASIGVVDVASISVRDHWGLLDIQPHPLWLVVIAIAVLWGSPASFLAGLLAAGSYLGLLLLRPGPNELPLMQLAQPPALLLTGTLIGEAVSRMHRRAVGAERRYAQVFELWRTFYERHMATVQAKTELEKLITPEPPTSKLWAHAQNLPMVSDEALYEGILETVTGLLHVGAAAVYVATDGVFRLRAGLPAGVPGRPDELSMDAAEAAADGTLSLLSSVGNGHHPEPVAGKPPQAAALSRRLVGPDGRVLGLVVLERVPEAVAPFAGAYLQQIAALASLALHNSVAYHPVEAVRDGPSPDGGDGRVGTHPKNSWVTREIARVPVSRDGGSSSAGVQVEQRVTSGVDLQERTESRAILIARPEIGEEESSAVLNVLASGQLAQGQRVASFERRFADLCEVDHAVATSSGTAALHLALLAHDIGPGDEVITTPFSFAATANVIRMVGATPVFVDIEPDTYNLDPELVETAVTSRTRAILPVHLYGNPCDMEALSSIADRHRLAIIEDACQAHLALVRGRPVGSFGTGCFSFYGTKNMTMGEGGIVTTEDPAVAERIRLLRNHGQSERYRHVILGYNLRLTEMQAAMGLAQIDKLLGFTERRIANAGFLTDRIGARVQTPVARAGHRHVFHQYTIRVPQRRDAWASRLAARGIGTAVHYPVPIHLQPAYRERAYQVSMPVAEVAAGEVLSLPVHPGLTTRDLNRIADEVAALCP